MSFNEDSFFATLNKAAEKSEIDHQTISSLIKQWFDAPKSYWDELETRNLHAMQVVPIPEHQEVWGELAELNHLQNMYKEFGDRALHCERIEDACYILDALEYIQFFLSVLRDTDAKKHAGGETESKKDGQKGEKKDEKKGENKDGKKDDKNDGHRDGFGGGSGGRGDLRGFGTGYGREPDAMGGGNEENGGWQGRMW